MSTQSIIASPALALKPVTPPTPAATSTKNAGQAEAGLRQAWSSPCPGAPHGVADRMPPFGRILRHCDLRGARHGMITHPLTKTCRSALRSNTIQLSLVSPPPAHIR
jgi:hypothetical protein